MFSKRRSKSGDKGSQAPLRNGAALPAESPPTPSAFSFIREGEEAALPDEPQSSPSIVSPDVSDSALGEDLDPGYLHLAGDAEEAKKADTAKLPEKRRSKSNPKDPKQVPLLRGEEPAAFPAESFTTRLDPLDVEGAAADSALGEDLGPGYVHLAGDLEEAKKADAARIFEKPKAAEAKPVGYRPPLIRPAGMPKASKEMPASPSTEKGFFARAWDRITKRVVKQDSTAKKMGAGFLGVGSEIGNVGRGVISSMGGIVGAGVSVVRVVAIVAVSPIAIVGDLGRWIGKGFSKVGSWLSNTLTRAALRLTNSIEETNRKMEARRAESHAVESTDPTSNKSWTRRMAESILRQPADNSAGIGERLISTFKQDTQDGYNYTSRGVAAVAGFVEGAVGGFAHWGVLQHKSRVSANSNFLKAIPAFFYESGISATYMVRNAQEAAQLRAYSQNELGGKELTDDDKKEFIIAKKMKAIDLDPKNNLDRERFEKNYKQTIQELQEKMISLENADRVAENKTKLTTAEEDALRSRIELNEYPLSLYHRDIQDRLINTLLSPRAIVAKDTPAASASGFSPERFMQLPDRELEATALPPADAAAAPAPTALASASSSASPSRAPTTAAMPSSTGRMLSTSLNTSKEEVERLKKRAAELQAEKERLQAERAARVAASAAKSASASSASAEPAKAKTPPSPEPNVSASSSTAPRSSNGRGR